MFSNLLRQFLGFSYPYQPSAGLPSAANDNHCFDALLVIDVQKEFCDASGARGNRETENICAHIARIVPEFRNAAIQVYAIYYINGHYKDPDEIDFYKFKLDTGDIIVDKWEDSAIKGSHIQKILRSNGHSNLLVCGFNTNSCVSDTVIDARKAGYQVTVLADMIGNGKRNWSPLTLFYILGMMARGVSFKSSQSVLSTLRPDAS